MVNHLFFIFFAGRTIFIVKLDRQLIRKIIRLSFSFRKQNSVEWHRHKYACAQQMSHTKRTCVGYVKDFREEGLFGHTPHPSSTSSPEKTHPEQCKFYSTLDSKLDYPLPLVAQLACVVYATLRLIYYFYCPPPLPSTTKNFAPLSKRAVIIKGAVTLTRC